MRKRIALLLSIVMVLMLSTVAFAAEQDTVVTEEPIEEYTSVLRVSAELSKGGACSIGVTEKIDLDSITGTLKLVNSSGKIISTKTGTFTKHGSIFTLNKSFTLPNSGRYKVKFTLKSYKGSKFKETITGKTNTVSK